MSTKVGNDNSMFKKKRSSDEQESRLSKKNAKKSFGHLENSG